MSLLISCIALSRFLNPFVAFLSNEQAIPEALPERQDAANSHLSYSGGTQDAKRFATAVAPQKKLFPSEFEGAVSDAANAWTKPGDSFLTAASADRGSGVDLRETPTSSLAGSMHGGVAGTLAASTVDGGMMPFDMDVPVAYSMASAGIASGIPNAAMSDLASPSAISAVGSTDEGDQIDRDAIDAAAIMDSIETDRIPCPRLCGATFSFGVGGLAGA